MVRETGLTGESNPLAVVQAWQDAANGQQIDRLLELSHPNIGLIGPRGGGHGHQLLRDWLGRAGLSLETLRAFVGGEAVVLEQRGRWRGVETGEVAGEATIASRFRVEGGRVARFERYDALKTALDEAGLTHSDEVPI